MRRQIVYMFTGQGSQYYKMGLELYNTIPTFNMWMIRLDTIIKDLTGESVLLELYHKEHRKSDIFDNLLLTNSAIFMVEYSLAQVLIERGIYPDTVLGSSLGEYTSCTIAGVMGYEDIIECLVNQVQALKEKCDEGRMIAVLDDPGLFYKNPVFYNNSELVSVNYHHHFVISGAMVGIAKIVDYLKKEMIAYEKIPVRYGFHSSCIEPAANTYLKYLNSKVYKMPKVNYVSSLAGTKMGSFKQNFLWEVVRMPIKLNKAMKNIEKENTVYIDLGPSGTMANFAKNT